MRWRGRAPEALVEGLEVLAGDEEGGLDGEAGGLGGGLCGDLVAHDLVDAAGGAVEAVVLVEGGAGVHATMFEQRLVDEVVLYIAPKVVGGPGTSWVGGKGLAQMSDAWRLALDERIDDFDGDLRLTGTVLPVDEPRD